MRVCDESEETMLVVRCIQDVRHCSLQGKDPTYNGSFYPAKSAATVQCRAVVSDRRFLNDLLCAASFCPFL